MAWTQEQAAAYAAANPDVMKAFQGGTLNNGDTNLASAMQAHYGWAGQKEGRAAPTTQPAPTNPPLGNGAPALYDASGKLWSGKTFQDDISTLGLLDGGKGNVPLYASQAAALAANKAPSGYSDIVAGPVAPGNSNTNFGAYAPATSPTKPAPTGTSNGFGGPMQPNWQPYQGNQQFQPYGSFGQQSQYSQQQYPYAQQKSPYAYQNPFQSSTYSQPSNQAFNTQNNPFNRSNQGGLLSGGSYQFGGLLNY